MFQSQRPWPPHSGHQRQRTVSPLQPQRSGADQQAPEFGLDFLPPYSPDLNPIERSGTTRRLCLHNRYFGFLDGVVAAVEDQFAEWITPNDSSADYAQLLKTLL